MIKHLKNQIIIAYLIILFATGICCAILLLLVIYKQKIELNQIAQIINGFIREDYNYRAPITEEGVKSKLFNLLEQLGKKIAFTNHRLQEEKEGTKALVTDISHQLKTPLASLNTCFSLMSEEDLSKEEQAEFLLRSKEQVARLERLIAALVNISRLEIGLIHIRKEVSDLKETIIQAINSVYLKAEEKDIAIELMPIENTVIPHDAKWTAEAIANVLDNAIKYSPSKSTVKITIKVMANVIRIEIQDQGIGIKKEEYNQVFQRFYRGKSEIVKKSEGSGVGLYLTRKILEEQGGTIKAVSKEGEGTTFVLQLLRT
jgi:signal transduction histidine kinase